MYQYIHLAPLTLRRRSSIALRLRWCSVALWEIVRGRLVAHLAGQLLLGLSLPLAHVVSDWSEVLQCLFTVLAINQLEDVSRECSS